MVKKNNLKMCNNFHEIHASIMIRILHVKADLRGDKISFGRKVEGRAKHGHFFRPGARENGVLMHIDEISMRGYKVSGYARRGNGVMVIPLEAKCTCTYIEPIRGI